MLPQRNHDRRRESASYFKFSPMGFLMKKIQPLSGQVYPRIAPSAITPRLDWFQALGIKRYTFGGQGSLAGPSPASREWGDQGGNHYMKKDKQGWGADFPMREEVEDYTGRVRAFVINCHEGGLGFTVRAEEEGGRRRRLPVRGLQRDKPLPRPRPTEAKDAPGFGNPSCHRFTRCVSNAARQAEWQDHIGRKRWRSTGRRRGRTGYRGPCVDPGNP